MCTAALGRSVCYLGDRAWGEGTFRGYMSVSGTVSGVHHRDLGEGCVGVGAHEDRLCGCMLGTLCLL